VTDRIDSELAGFDGTPLFLRTWKAETPRGLVYFVHGLGEHGGRYEELAALVNDAGFTAGSADHRGHGRSGGLRGHVDGFVEYDRDLDIVLKHFREAEGADLPLLLFAQSMGGLVALKFVLDHPDVDLAGVALSNACLGVAVKAPKVKVAAARLLSRLLPRMRLDNELKTVDLCKDPVAVKAYEDDPLVGRLISTRWYTSLLAAMEETNARAAELKVPSLWLIGAKDVIVDPDSSRRFVAGVPGGTAEAVEFPEAMHEPHNEPEKADVHAALLTWIDARMAAITTTAEDSEAAAAG